MTLDWLIIGGGIHGVHIAARLIGEGGVPPDRVGIVDPAARLLAGWRARTEACGMTHLRSPSVHHLDVDPMSLHRFAGRRKRPKGGLFAFPYNRPALDLFNAHCDKVLKDYDLAGLHIRGRAVACAVSVDGATVEIAGPRGPAPAIKRDTLETRRLVLAVGPNESLNWPAWAPRESQLVQHIFASDFAGWPTRAGEAVAVVGGGITAVQAALRLAGEGHRVHIIARHPLREHQFDSDPGWLGPKLMMSFARERDYGRRRAMIQKARWRGSVPPELVRVLRRAVGASLVSWREAEVEQCSDSSDGVRLNLSGGERLELNRLIIATGLAGGRPGGKMVDELAESASLRCSACGYPIVNQALQWHPNIHVCGPLAELELGPVSRNIAGARRAGDRLLQSVDSL